MELPLALTQRLQAGRCVLFLGAGIGYAMRNADGDHMPTGKELAHIVDEKLGLDTGLDDLAVVAQIAVIRRRGRADLLSRVQEALSGFEPLPELIAITKLRWQAIFTTNYDRGIVRAYELSPHAPQNAVVISTAADVVNIDRRFDVPIYYVHGALFAGDSTNVLITQDDYSLFRQSRRMLFDVLRSSFGESTFVYLGYSNQDPNWRTLLGEITAEFGSAPLPQSFRVVPHTEALEREMLRARGITCLNGNLQEFSEALDAAIDFDEPSTIANVSDIPLLLRDAYTESPAPVLRFLNSWEVCAEADFGEVANVGAFLRGDRPNWGTVASGLTFKRDLLAEISNETIDFVTSPQRVRKSIVVLGPAGYGVSTLLMQLAHSLVEEKLRYVFRLKQSCAVIEADIVFATQAADGNRPVFIVDEAALRKAQVRSSIRALSQDGNLSAVFVLGSRLNEWRVARENIGAQEYLVEPLSDPEITALLKLLESTGELGELGHLPADMQFSAIKIRNSKELLVTLREVTDGKPFEAILEDEYRNIDPPIAKQLYELSCALTQQGDILRDTVAARVLNTDLSLLFKEVTSSLEGVVFHEEIDAVNGIFGFRARHRIIAQIVWQRCLSSHDRERALLAILPALNLTYRTDRDAFDSLVRNDELVDSLGSLEARIAYFEAAGLLDPKNPFVKQHFARMYLRADRYQSSLGQINLAIGENGGIRSLYHTRGLALSRLTRVTEGEDVARKYLAQAEADFSKSIEMGPNDDYGYVSLAELYREWAERSKSDDDANSYFRKAEEVINEGLRFCSAHDRLYIESSKIADTLGQQPERLAALKRAVESKSASTVARFLYGRALRLNERFDDAAKILKPILLEDPNAYRAAMEFSECRLALSGDFLEGAAVLKQATLLGMRDARFVAMLGGMQFLGKRLDDAEATFSAGRQLPAEQQRRVRYKPVSKNDSGHPAPVKLNGQIVKVGFGFAFAAVPGLLDIFVGTSRLADSRLEVGDEIVFVVNFNAVSASADVTTLRRVSRASRVPRRVPVMSGNIRNAQDRVSVRRGAS